MTMRGNWPRKEEKDVKNEAWVLTLTCEVALPGSFIIDPWNPLDDILFYSATLLLHGPLVVFCIPLSRSSRPSPRGPIISCVDLSRGGRERTKRWCCGFRHALNKWVLVFPLQEISVSRQQPATTWPMLTHHARGGLGGLLSSMLPTASSLFWPFP